MRCTNMGSDYGDEDVSWECKADLPRWFKLGSTDVVCEGYRDSEDQYVLKGGSLYSIPRRGGVYLWASLYGCRG
jgi:hypothetical protein